MWLPHHFVHALCISVLSLEGQISVQTLVQIAQLQCRSCSHAFALHFLFGFILRIMCHLEHLQIPVQQLLCCAMRELLSHQAVTVLVAKSSTVGGISHRRQGQGRSAPKDVMPREWQALVSRRFLLSTDDYAQGVHDNIHQDHRMTYKMFQRIHPPDPMSQWVPFVIGNRGAHLVGGTQSP